MFGSGILDFAIGLVFTFLAMSLAAGAGTEAISSILKTRSQTLLQGIKDLLNDQTFQGLAKELYTDVLVNPLVDGTTPPNRKTNPAYIDPNHFAVALIDAVKRVGQPAPPPAGDTTAGAQQHPLAPGNPLDDFRAQVDALPDVQIKRMLLGMIDRAAGDEKALHDALAKWFDSAMDRVSGVYKRWTQLWSFLVALVIAVALNVSTIDVATSLWKQPIDTKAIVGIADEAKLPDYVKAIDQLNGMPIGWNASLLPPAGATGDQWAWWLFLHVVGWLITAFATLFGAPFWFDTLQQLVRLKGSGPSPADKKNQTAAAS